jgi:hypothetical protein
MTKMIEKARRIGVVAASALLVALVTGCAHPISISPDLNKVPQASAKINKTAAYYVSAEDLAREVETPGGGGDKVKYAPYRDLESGLYKAFSQVFTNVVKLKSPADAAAIGAQGVALVIKPTITTNSSSDSLVTWPPTQFSVDILCSVTDASGKELVSLRSTGQGAATFSEFTSDFSLSAKRASQDALTKLVQDLAASDALRR